MLRELHVSGHRFPHDSLAHVSCLLSVSYYDMDFVRDYESDSSSSGGTEYADWTIRVNQLIPTIK